VHISWCVFSQSSTFFLHSRQRTMANEEPNAGLYKARVLPYKCRYRGVSDLICPTTPIQRPRSSVCVECNCLFAKRFLDLRNLKIPLQKEVTLGQI